MIVQERIVLVNGLHRVPVIACLAALVAAVLQLQVQHGGREVGVIIVAPVLRLRQKIDVLG